MARSLGERITCSQQVVWLGKWGLEGREVFRDGTNFLRDHGFGATSRGISLTTVWSNVTYLRQPGSSDSGVSYLVPCSPRLEAPLPPCCAARRSTLRSWHRGSA